jgi:site-specific DNA-methyltransferase (adenine-specific)
LGWKTIKSVFRGVLDEAQLGVLEATENNARKSLTWQEKVLSVDKVHRIHSTNAALSGKRWGIRETAKLFGGRTEGSSKTNIGLATYLAEFLHANDKEIWAAESATDAYRILASRKEAEVSKDIAAVVGQNATTTSTVKYTGKAPIPVAPDMPDDEFFAGGPAGPGGAQNFGAGVTGPEDTGEMPGVAGSVPVKPEPLHVPLSRMLLRQEDHQSLTALANLGLESVDHIITDPPYGIDMEMLNQQNPHGSMKDINTVAKEHDVEENLRLLRRFIPLAYDTLRQRGFLVFWCDPVHWWNLTCLCEEVGFGVQRWPLVWQKTSACMNQAASTNWTKTIEFAVVARKGVATLVRQQPSCVWTGGNDIECKALGHPFAKPFGLWKWVYDAVAIPGQEVLDPFVGSGSSMIPAIRNKLRPRGIECNEVHYGRLVVNIQNLYKSLDPECVFV